MGSLYDDTKLVLPKEVKRMMESGIPKISGETLLERYKKIKPIVITAGQFYLVQGLTNRDLRTISCKDLNLTSTIREIPSLTLVEIEKERLIELRDFICLHKFDFPNEFVGTVSDVLVQFPEELYDQSDAFQLIEYPKVNEHFRRYADGRHHLSRIMAYKVN